MTDTEFERLCAAYQDGAWGKASLPFVSVEVRRGMLAALRAMRDSAHLLDEAPRKAGVDVGTFTAAEGARTMLDELIRQGEEGTDR